MWDLIVSVPDHCFSSYFVFNVLASSFAVKFTIINEQFLVRMS